VWAAQKAPCLGSAESILFGQRGPSASKVATIMAKATLGWIALSAGPPSISMATFVGWMKLSQDG